MNENEFKAHYIASFLACAKVTGFQSTVTSVQAAISAADEAWKEINQYFFDQYRREAKARNERTGFDYGQQRWL
jgi:hypothetical protein